MKTTLLSFIGCLALLVSSFAFAYSSYYEVQDASIGSPTGCGGYACVGDCCPYGSNCECTDPFCHSTDRSCIGACTCCEAFGNVGAR